MCGIVGYVGTYEAKKIVIDGLKKLEYRGCDSAGAAFYENDKFYVYKELGKPENLSFKIKMNNESNIGIGHTRLATNGKISLTNCHPHVSHNERFMIVHNGVISNYDELRKKYLSDYSFKSETDTEIIVALIEKLTNEGLSTLDAIGMLPKLLLGTYAILLVDNFFNNTIYFIKNKTPMIIGKSKDKVIIASDAKPIIGLCDEYLELNDEAYGYVTKSDVCLKNSDRSFNKLDKESEKELMDKKYILF